MNQGSRPKKTKRPDNRPARQRYWVTGRLAVRKIKNLVVHNGLTVEEATRQWEDTRKRGRAKLGFLPYNQIKKLEKYERK
jgi:hypothetical protein